MRRLHSLEAPTVWHRETTRYAATELQTLTRYGILTLAPEPEEGPPPQGGPNVAYRRTSKGLFGVALEEDQFFDPIPLTEDDVRLYRVAVPKLIAHIRVENEIVGDHSEVEAGLIPIGQKQVAGFGTLEVFLSIPNSDTTAFTDRCLGLRKAHGIRLLAVLVPIPITLAVAVREQLNGRDIVLIAILPCTDNGHVRIDWNNLIVSSTTGPRSDGVYPPKTIVFRGREYSCKLNAKEMVFLDIAFRNEEVPISTIYSRKGPIWEGTFVNEKTCRDKVTQFLSRLNRKLSNASFPLAFSLPRGRQSIVH